MRTGPDGDREPGPLGQAVSRRNFLRFVGAGAAAATLAACGSSRAHSSSGAPTGAAPSNVPSNIDTQMTSFLKKTFNGGGPHSGTGLTFPFAASLLLSGSAAPYGEAQLKGINLAVQQIKAAGGPDFVPQVKDATASTTAGATAMTQWGQAHIPFCISSAYFDEGNQVRGAEQYKILTFDAGGGNLPPFQSKPYLWGTRALDPSDAYGGIMQYLAATSPGSTKLAIAGDDFGALGAVFEAALKKAINQYFPKAKVVAVEYTEASSSGSYDFSPALAKLEGASPDVILPLVFGSDPASFMKDYTNTTLTAKVIGFDYFPSSANLAGNAIKGFMFAADYFNASDPGNPWGKMFAETFEAANNNQIPSYYSANYYENVFFLWQLVSRVLASGGDPHSSTALQSTLETNTTLLSVYGQGATTGSITISPTTHTPSSRPLGLFKVTSSSTTAQPTELAAFNIGGADFKLL